MLKEPALGSAGSFHTKKHTPGRMLKSVYDTMRSA